MKAISLLVILSLASPVFGQRGFSRPTGKIEGTVLDKDGVTPVQGAEILVEELLPGYPIQVRSKHTSKTDMNGKYSLSDLPLARVRITVIVNNQPVLMKGDKMGDEAWTIVGLLTVDFNLGKGTATVTLPKISN